MDLFKLDFSIGARIDFSLLHNLKILAVAPIVNQYEILGLNLIEFDCSDNQKIINVSHMKNLKILIVGLFAFLSFPLLMAVTLFIL